MKRLVWGLSALALGVLFAACGDSSTSEQPSGGSTGSSSTGTGGTGGAGGGSGGGSGAGCDPACQAPQFCSVTKVCIDAGTCAEDGDCTAGTVCDTMTKTCIPGGGCGAQEAKVEAIPPNLLIVLDRSCSMTSLVSGKSKWQIAVEAINKMTTDFNAKIRFGITLFPDLDTNNCGQGAIPIPVAPGTEPQIQDLLTKSLNTNNKYYPNGPCVTNIDTAMKQATTEPAFDDTDRASYALLITDGKQAGCNAANGDADTLMFITDLYQSRNVPTFVLGFGAGIDGAQMDIFADAGGVPASMASPKYYKAEDQMSLDAALNAIATKTLSCTLALQSQPPKSDEIYVFFDNNPTQVPKDATHMDGWDYDPANNTVTFYGPACDKLKSGTVMDLDVVFGCAQPTPN